jgi:hypothetical protein
VEIHDVAVEMTDYGRVLAAFRRTNGRQHALFHR